MDSVYYYCVICRQTVCQKRLKKHHNKMHPDENFDIYVQSPDFEPQMRHIDSKPLENASTMAKQAEQWGYQPTNDSNMVHVSCEICQNRMPATDLDLHLKRRHNADEKLSQITTKLAGTSLNGVAKAVSNIPFSKFYKTNSNAQVNTKSSAEAFYTIRVSESQMQELLQQKRVVPKDGFFYLK